MTAPPYPPPHASGPAPNTMPPIPRASKGRVMRRGVQRSFRGIGAGVRAIFSGRPFLVAVLLLLLPLTIWLAYDRWFASSPSSARTGPQTVVQLPEPQVTQDYLKAVQKGDTDAAWNTLNPTEKARRVARNEDKTLLSQVFQLEQQSKMTYAAVHYTGGYQDTTGRVTYYFYVGDVGTGKSVRMLPLIFGVDRNGMLSEVDDALYENARQQIMGG